MTSLLSASALRLPAEQALVDIAESLATPSDGARAAHPSLGGGRASRALFFYHLARSTGDSAHRNRAKENLESCATAMASSPLPISLYSGLSGIAWLIAHLQRGLQDGEQYDLDEMDALLIESLTPARSHQLGFDLISGLVGVGVYFLERMPSNSAEEGLRRVIGGLVACSERSADGVTWRTAPHLLLPEQREFFPLGRYDLGVAHGAPGVVAFLAHLCSNGALAHSALPLLADAVRWLLGRRFPALPEHSYPHWFAPDGAADAVATRAAWCYGDPGVAYALLAAARALAEPAVEAIARRMAISSLRRDVTHACVIDAPLCHGSAGLAHLAHVMWTYTQDPTLAAAAERWLRVTLEFRKPGRGVAGFESYWGVDRKWGPDSSFLTGAAGIGLALLFALHPNERSWDRLLLMS